MLPNPYGPYSLGMINETYRVIKFGRYSFIGVDWMGYVNRIPYNRPNLYRTEMGAACARVSALKRFYESRRY